MLKLLFAFILFIFIQSDLRAASVRYFAKIKSFDQHWGTLLYRFGKESKSCKVCRESLETKGYVPAENAEVLIDRNLDPKKTECNVLNHAEMLREKACNEIKEIR